MQTMHSTLQIGPADWDPVRLPREEFQERLALLWNAMPEARGVIAFGSQAAHAELAYLTNFTPKLEPGIALISRSGEAKLMSGGGVNMLPAAKPLTWIEQMLGLRDFAHTISQWVQKLEGDGPVAVVGGFAMPYRMRLELNEALGASPGLLDGDMLLRGLMRAKSVREVNIIRQAVRILDVSCRALTQAAGKGRSATQAVLAAENVAYSSGAQDAGLLFSLDGGRTLRPFNGSGALMSDSLQAYVKIKYLGYWSEGFVRAAKASSPEWRQAQDVLRALLPQVRAGITYGDIRDACQRLLSPDMQHAAIDDPVASLGLALENRPPDSDVVTPGHILSLRIGVSGREAATIASAVVHVRTDAVEVMWSTE